MVGEGWKAKFLPRVAPDQPQGAHGGDTRHGFQRQWQIPRYVRRWLVKRDKKKQS